MCMLLALSMVLAVGIVPAFANSPIQVSVDGKNLSCDQPPILENDRTLVPIRAIFEALGAKVDWDGLTQKVTATRDSSVITLQIGKKSMVQDGKSLLLDVAPKILNDRTLVPLRAVSESFGANVNWIQDLQKVEVTTNQNNTTGGSNTGSQPTNSFEKQVFDLVNQERAKAGLSPLAWSDDLANVARAHSKDMSDRNYMSHTNPDGLSPFNRMKNYGITYRTAAENIAAGQSTPQEVMNSWMNSSGHRANILNPNLTKIGVGYYNGGSYRHYWTQNFIG